MVISVCSATVTAAARTAPAAAASPALAASPPPGRAVLGLALQLVQAAACFLVPVRPRTGPRPAAVPASGAK